MALRLKQLGIGLGLFLASLGLFLSPWFFLGFEPLATFCSLSVLVVSSSEFELFCGLVGPDCGGSAANSGNYA